MPSDCQKNKISRKTEQKLYPTPKRLFTVQEAAIYMGRTVWGMRGLIWKGRVPIIQDGRKIYLDIRDLDAYIEKTKETFTY